MIENDLPVTSDSVAYPFLRQGGEMGNRMRTHNWALTPLGTPVTWPQSLRTTLSIILASKFPMFLFWGNELRCFYNDAFRLSLGNDGKHPHALGRPGADVWVEIWGIIYPLIERALSDGEATWSEDQFIPIYRNGSLEDAYWTFSYSPVPDEFGQPAGVLVTCTETTAAVLNRKKWEERETYFRRLTDTAPAILWITEPDGHCSYLNKQWYEQTGQTEAEAEGFGWLDATHPADQDEAGRLFAEANEKRIPFNAVYRLRQKDGSYRWVIDKGRPRFSANGEYEGIIGTVVDVHDQKVAEEETNRFKFMADNASDPFILMREDGTFAYLNQLALDRWGYTADEAQHIRVPDVDPIYNETVFGAAFAASQTGKLPPFETLHRKKDGTTYPVEVNMGGLLLEGKPHLFAVARDITDRKQTEETLRESESFARSVIDDSPVANLVLVGLDMRIRTINENMLAMLGRDASIIGRPFMDAVPELIPTPLMDRLRHMLATGETYYQPEERTDLLRHGQPYTGYFNYIYKALTNTTGGRYGVLVTATEVTEQVLARQKVEEAEVALRGAIEMAELGTWQIDLTTSILNYSARLREWFGIGNDEIITPERAYQPIRAEDRPRVRAAIAHALTPGSDGIYDIEYSVDPAEAGRERVLHIQGRVFVNEQGKPYKLSGTAQDVTEQRRVRQELERQVQERTRQLQESVQDLSRSNQNLQQFAYVASHDLQEPLRKIQQFGDLLRNQYADQLGEGIDYLQRMQVAASRMSVLIKDLLAFSRISTQQENTAPVNLTEVIETVLYDLEIAIGETGAQLTVEPLPTVQGDASQLGQLFQNLLSNALKFRRSGTVPVIHISPRRVATTHLPDTVKPTRAAATYQRIDVSDNGIGFEQKYASRIFQVFQRLHGKDQFAGTGIGLAICEKVAANHGGAITATSQPGQGTTFSVYLPV